MLLALLSALFVFGLGIWPFIKADKEVQAVRTFLHQVYRGDLFTVKQHLEQHPDYLLLRHPAGHTPLHLAILSKVNLHRKLALVRLLLAQGADVNARIEGHLWDYMEYRPDSHKSQNFWGYLNTPLHLAVEQGNTELVTLLLAKGAKVNVVNEDQETPLQQLTCQAETPILQLLLERGADSNRSYDDTIHEGKSLLHLAVDCGKPDWVRLLLKYGANPYHQTRLGLTPFMYSSKHVPSKNSDIRAYQQIGILLKQAAAKSSFTAGKMN